MEKYVVTDFTSLGPLTWSTWAEYITTNVIVQKRVIYGKEIIKSQTTIETRLC